MEYLNKKEVIETLDKFRKAREAKRNCSKQSATEYAIFDYCIKIIETLKTYQKD